MTISTPTILSETSASTTSADIASNSISPQANALLVVVAAYTFATNATRLPFSIADTFSPNLTWNKAQEDESRDTSVGACIAIWTAKCGATPGSGTITASSAATANRRSLHVIEVASGYNTTTPVKQSNKNNSTSSPIVVTLGATPDTDSLVINGIGQRGATTATKDADHTLLDSISAGTLHFGGVQYDEASADTTAQWTTTAAFITSVSIEIDAAGGTAHTKSISNTVGLADALAKVVGYHKTISNTVGTTDVISKVTNLKRSLSNTVGITDALTKAAGYIRALSNTVGLTDAINTFIAKIVSISNTIGITDTISKVTNLKRTISNTVGLTDLVSRVTNLKRSLTDTVGLTDTRTRTISYIRTLSNTIGLTDLVAGLKNFVEEVEAVSRAILQGSKHLAVTIYGKRKLAVSIYGKLLGILKNYL